MRIGLTGVLGKPSTRLSSHNGGYTYYILSRLEQFFGTAAEVIEMEDCFNYDIIVLTEGLNFREGVFNLFGGVTEKLISNLEWLNSYSGDVYSFGPETIDYTNLVKSRRIPTIFTMPEVFKIDEIDFHEDKLILGDSHSLSVYERGWKLSRNDGKTMNGFINERLENYVDVDRINHLRFYSGNIDIRHHICRLYKPQQRETMIDMQVSAIGEQLLDLKLESVEVVELLPIEHIGRKIPKTGFYDGKPYWGSWQERNDARHIMNYYLKDMCISYGFTFLEWPDMTNIIGELDEAYMESRQSVHLAPKSYMFKDTFIC